MKHYKYLSICIIFLAVILSPVPSRAATNVSGNITQDTTWTLSGSPYVVTDDVLVRQASTDAPVPTLTIEPGVQVRFNAYKGLAFGQDYNGIFRGKLSARGTAEAPIIFTSNQSVPAPGNWKGLIFHYGQEGSFENCIIEYAGWYYNGNIYAYYCPSITIKNSIIRYSSSHGMNIQGSSTAIIGGEDSGNTITNNTGYGIWSDNYAVLNVSNNTISNNGSYPLRVRASRLAYVNGNAFTGNANQSVEVLGGEWVTEDATWRNIGIPYVIAGDIRIRQSDSGSPVPTVVIAPGVELRFNANTTLYVGHIYNGQFYGRLLAQGIASAPIVFTSNQAIPSPGFWRGIYFDWDHSDLKSILEYCTIEYGGGYTGNIYINHASPIIKFSTIRNGLKAGISIFDIGNPIIECSNFNDNQTGVYASCSSATLTNNNFLKNENYGVNSYNSTVDARNNWWGDANGPNQTGDKTYGSVNFIPWLTAESGCITAPPANSPPYSPSSPSPADNAVRVPFASPVSMTWQGGDPNGFDTVVYDVYLGTAIDAMSKVADSTSSRSYAFSSPAQGTTYFWQVKARDNLGGETLGPNWKFTTVGNPPDLGVSSVTWMPTESISAGQTVTFTATVQNSGTGPVVDAFNIQFEVDGVSIGSQNVNRIIPAGETVQATRTWTASVGDHTVQVIADSTSTVAESDETNNSLSQALPPVVDTLPPELTGTTPANGSFLKQLSQIIVNLHDRYGTVNDPAVISSFTVKNSADETVPGAVTESNDRFTYTPSSPFADDTYTVSLIATDLEGNTQFDTFSFTIDSVAPPAPQVNAVTNPTYNPHPVITGIKEAYAAIVLNNTRVIGNTAETSWQYTASLASGDNQLTFIAKDRAGNESTAATIQVFFDDIPPQAITTLTANGQGSGTSIALDWTGYNESPQGDIAHYRIYAETTTFTALAGLTPKQTIGAHQFTYTLANLARGTTYYLAVAAVDEGGNALTTATPITCTPTDTQAPENATNLRVQSFDTRLVLTWDASTNTAGDLFGYRIYLDNSPVTTAPSTQTTYELTGLNPAAAYSCKITSRDDTGNESAGATIMGVTLLPNPSNLAVTAQSGYASLSWSGVQPSQHVKHYAVYASQTDFTTVDGMSPRQATTATSAFITGLANNVRYYFAVTAVNTSDGELKTVTTQTAMPVPDAQGPSLTNAKVGGAVLTDGCALHKSALFTVDAADASGVSRVEFYLNGALVKTVYSGPFECYCNAASLPDGNNALRIDSYDTFGNKSTLEYMIDLTLDAPHAPAISQPASGTVVNKSTIAVSGCAEKNTDVLLMRNGAPTGDAVPVDSSGKFTSSVSLVPGENLIQAVAGNRAGVSAPSPQISVTCDNTIPAGPLNVAAQAAGSGRIKLSWRTPAGTIKGYNVYRASSSFGTIASARKANTNLVAATSFSDIPETDGLYYYRVTSVSTGDNESDLSDEVSAISDRIPPRAESIIYEPEGNLDPQTGRMSSGKVNLSLTASEPLAAIPFMSITPDGGLPIPVELTQVTDAEFSGSFVISSTTPSGTGRAVFSGRDAAGNRGTEILSGSTIRIDTAGPDVRSLAIQPSSPIRNDGGAVTVTVTAGLNEQGKTGSIPELSCLLSGSGRQAIPITLRKITTQPGDAETWQGAFTLPADAGLASPETFQFRYRGSDSLDNTSETMLCNSIFQVYRGDLPPLPAPRGFKGISLPGGAIKLSWDKIDAAVGYEIYRKAPGEADLTSCRRLGAVLECLDQPESEGSYAYSIASIRQENSQEALSGRTSPVEAVSDSTPPEMPANLSLELLPRGIKAQWETASNETLAYRLYRSASEIATVQGLTPVLANISGTDAIDSSPSPSDHYYAVTAVDQAGNESPPSNSPYLNFGILPVSTLRVIQNDAEPPVIAWTYPPGINISGYNIYLGLQKLNQALITGLTYADQGYAGDGRAYTVRPVDANQQEGLGREIHFPKIGLALKNTAVQKGVMNRLEYEVQNLSGTAITQARLNVQVGNHSHMSDPFPIEAGAVRTIPVIVGGYPNLSASADVITKLEITPNEGERVEIARASSVSVEKGMLILEIANETFTRGGAGKVSFTLRNTGAEEIEVTTAKSSGSAASDEISALLVDNDENVIATAHFKQNTGYGLMTLPNGNTVARIPADGRFSSDPFLVQVPAKAPADLALRIKIDKVYYHQGRSDQVALDGLSGNRRVSLFETAYYGDITSITPQAALPGSDVEISGCALDRATGRLMPGVALKLVITVQGFERTYNVITSAEGAFSFKFKPLTTESGLYTVRAVHPDIFDKPVQGRFVVNGVAVSPTALSLNMPKNYEQTLAFNVKSGEGAHVENLAILFDAADQPGGALPQGVHVTPGAPISSLASGASGNLTCTVWADNSADPGGQFVLRVASGDSTWGKITVKTLFSTALPVLRFSPDHIQTGIDQGGIVTEAITLQNAGTADLQDVALALIQADGTPAPAWVQLANTVSEVGAIEAGKNRLANITFSPGPSVPDGMYSFKLRVSSSNHQTTDINLLAAVTQSGTGNVLFKIADIYTGTVRGGTNQIVQGLAGADITIQNENVPTIRQTLVSDGAGEAYFAGLPAGRYKSRITAPSHKEYIGRLQVKPGVTAKESVFLEYNLVTVEWRVSETTIRDQYEIVLRATYETDVPAAVLVSEPVSATLPPMKAGDVYNGEFALTNHGLTRANNLSFNLPQGDSRFRYEILQALPPQIGSKETVAVAYRVTALQPTEETVTPASGGAGCTGGYSSCIKISYDYQCANGGVANGSASHCVSRPATCTGAVSGISSVIWDFGPSTGLPEGSGIGYVPERIAGAKCLPKPERRESDLCAPDPDCPSEKCRKETDQEKCQPAKSSVSILHREYNRNDTDLKIKVPGGFVAVERFYYGNKWHWNHLRSNLKFNYDAPGNILSIEKGMVLYRPKAAGALIFTNETYRIIRTDSGWRWEDTFGNWKNYQANGDMVAYGDRKGTIGKLSYEPGDTGRLTGIADRNDRQVIWFEYNADTLVSAVRDIDNRRAEYSYSNGLLARIKDVLNGETIHGYDASGRLAMTIDAAGRQSAVVYDDYGNIASVRDARGKGARYEFDYDESKKEYYARMTSPLGTVKEVWHDRAGDLKRIDLNGRTIKTIVKDGRSLITTDGQGYVTRRDYDEWDNLVRITYPDNSSASYEFEHKFNQRTKSIDERGIITSFEYDGRGNLVRQTEALGAPAERITVYSYDSDGNPLSKTIQGDALTPGSTSSLAYDIHGNVAASIDAESNTTRFAYDNMGNRLTKWDPAGKTWTYSYNARGWLTALTSPLNHVSQFHYDGAGNIIREVNPAGEEKNFEYNQDNQVTAAIDALGNAVTFEYNDDGKLAVKRDAEGHEIRYAYDTDARLIKIMDGNGNETVNVYESTAGSCGPSCRSGFERPSKTIFPTFTREYRHDRRGRKILERDLPGDADPVSASFSYDQAGNLISRTDRAGNITFYEYDELGRLRRITDPLNQAMTYEYDRRNNVVGLNDARGQRTAFAYDRNNLLTRETKPLGQETNYQYSPCGQLARKIDAKGQRTEYAYDDANRLAEIRYFTSSGGLAKSAAFTYDPAGNLKSWSDGEFGGAFDYDGAARRNFESVNYGGFELAIRHEHYKNGLKKNFTYPGGATVQYTYDSGGRPAGIQLPNAGLITFSRYKWNRPVAVSLPGGSAKQFAYDALMRSKRIASFDPGGNLALDYDYSYDGADNVVSRKTELGDYGYTYDNLYRLTGASSPNQTSETYSYDPAGNRLTSSAAEGLWDYNGNNELQSYNGVSFNYDANGNLIRKNRNGELVDYSYDVENRLTEVRDGTGDLAARYAYDPFGRRLLKEVQGEKIYYLYSDEGLVGEYAETGAEIRTYGFKPQSLWTTDPVFMQQGGSFYFYHNDHLGTPQKISDASGAVVWAAGYGAFGTAQADPNSLLVNNLRFGGQYFDSETGLHYNFHRYYNPETGTYIAPDPIGFEGEDLNLYRYVWNNPVNWFDKNGLAGDGQKAYIKEYQAYLEEYNNPVNWEPKGELKPFRLPPLGHSDFYASDRFDWTKEDKWYSNPIIPLIGTPRHFQQMGQSIADIKEAIYERNCNKNLFVRAMHRLQDYPFHAAKGYGEFGGHAWDSLRGINPDDDPIAWEWSNQKTKEFVEEWDKNCKCKN